MNNIRRERIKEYVERNDVATIKELQAMSQRLRVACLLDAGSNYLEVSETTGASSATISRVNRIFSFGTGAFKAAIDREKEAQND